MTLAGLARGVALVACMTAGIARADGTAALGKPLVDKDCHGCHVRQFGNADRIYLRADRRVQSLAQLKAQVAYCNTQLGTGYFPDEEEHIVAWLNEHYYKFKR